MHKMHNLFPASGPLPADWASTLQAIQLVSGSAPVLSGGALRDHFHGTAVKDLDIFLPWSAQCMADVYEWFETLGWRLIQNIPPSCEGLGEVTAVVGFSHEGATDLNIIFLDPAVRCGPLAVASRNDFGICQIAATFEGGDWQFEYTEAFINDTINETFTLTRTGDEDRSLRRFERLQAKYPGHRLVTPHITQD
jgi:hypothetical protein